jgi:hypothetical protein
VNRIHGGNNRPGMTLVEAMIALVICSLLFILLLSVYGSFVKMSRFQSSAADLENQFMLTSRVMEKDVRLAGFGIPGNGLYLQNVGTQNFSLVVLSDENDAKATLIADAQIGDSRIIVNTVTGTSANQWVCLVQGPSIAFDKISRIGSHAGSDTLLLGDSTVHALWEKNSTQVYFAQGVQYAIEIKNGKNCLVRTSFMNASPIGEAIDTFFVVPKDKAGADLGADYPHAKALGITLGGRVGAAGKFVSVTKSFDVDIRN